GRAPLRWSWWDRLPAGRGAPRAGRRASAPGLAAHRLGALGQLPGRHVLDVGGDGPAVPPGVLEPADAVAVELVLDGLQGPGAGGDGAVEGGVGVLDVDGEAHRGAADRRGAGVASFRRL